MPNGLIGDDDASLGQQILCVAEAGTETEIEPDGVTDDLGWEHDHLRRPVFNGTGSRIDAAMHTGCCEIGLSSRDAEHLSTQRGIAVSYGTIHAVLAKARDTKSSDEPRPPEGRAIALPDTPSGQREDSHPQARGAPHRVGTACQRCFTPLDPGSATCQSVYPQSPGHMDRYPLRSPCPPRCVIEDRSRTRDRSPARTAAQRVPH